MPLFRRRREPDAGPAPQAPDPDPSAPDSSARDSPVPDSAAPDSPDPEAPDGSTAPTPRPADAIPAAMPGPEPVSDLPPPAGPADASTVPVHERVDHLDLGALLLPSADGILDGLEVQLQADEATGQVLAVLVLDGAESAVELRAFAAPRRERLWHQVRPEIADGAHAAGGQTAEALGAWGVELLVQVPVTLPDGQQALQVSRIAGIDGPRWFVRATFLGRAAIEPDTAGRLQTLVEQILVVRGDGPMAPRDAIPLTVPGQQPGDPLLAGESFRDGLPGGAEGVGPDGVGPDGRQRLSPFERGPEITEIR